MKILVLIATIITSISNLYACNIDSKYLVQQSGNSILYIIPKSSDDTTHTTLSDFLGYSLKNDPKALIDLVRGIYAAARQHDLLDGFIFQQTQYQGKLAFSLSPGCSIKPRRNSLNPLQPYNPDNSFAEYLSAPFADRIEHPSVKPFSRLMTADSRSIIFFSRSGNIMVIPTWKQGQKSYTSLLDFSRDATDAEIIDIFTHIYKVLAQYPDGQGYKLSAHVGSKGSQVVPHLHLRLEKK
ncbi:MAG: DUF6940 family protein [Alphaproteobacteria bacterium]